jgi:hypothetical protein
MMRAVAEATRAVGAKTYVSLNAIMLDGTGMCGGCRVTVGGEMRFACVDGPESIVQATTPGLATGRHGAVTVHADQSTSRPGVFAGGDLSRGGATVILAMRDGRRATAAIHGLLSARPTAASGPIGA